MVGIMSRDVGLPKGWATIAIGELGRWFGGGTPSKANEKFWQDGSIPWISPKDMKVLRVTDSEDHITPLALEETNIGVFPAGTVLFVVRSGILARTFPVAISEVPATMNQDLKGIALSEGIAAAYLAYCMIGRENDVLKRCSKHGTTVASIDTNALHSYEIHLAPSPEQNRIVAKLEELFSDLDAGVAALKRAKANLKRYRAAVLKAAVEGKLTEQWRAENPPKEPAAKLLERILKERRKKWEQDQLAAYEANGKQPPKNWRDKYQEPIGLDTADLPKLPEGWCWASVDQILTYLRNGYFQSPSKCGTGTPILRINAVRPMRVDLSECRFLDEFKGPVQDYYIENGDLLFTRYNGSVDMLGVAGMVRGCTENVLHPDKLIRVKLAIPQPLSAFVEIAANAGLSRKHMVGRARTTAGQTGISGTDIRQMPIPLAPLREQSIVVNEVSERLSEIEAAQQAIIKSLKRSARLRQSILKQAFAGKLVPQDLADEPASVLLQRIRSAAVGSDTIKNSRKSAGTIRRRTAATKEAKSLTNEVS